MAWLSRSLTFAAFAPLLFARSADGQVSAGVTGSTFEWVDGRSEQALGAVLQIAPAPWLVVGTVPSLLRVRSAASADAQVGLADLPVYASLVHSANHPTRPTLAVTGSVSLPTGDASRGLGRGTSFVSGEAALALDPLPGLTIRGGGARLLRVAGETPSGVSTSTLFADVVLGSGTPTTLSIGGFGELRGDAPAGYETARGLTAAIAHTLRDGPTLLIGAGHSLAGVGPDWSLSIGFGTAFGGVAPVGATAPASRATGGLPRTAARGLSPLCAVSGC